MKVPRRARRILSIFRKPKLNDDLLRIVCTHHKTGTQLMGRLFADVATEYQLRFQSGPQHRLGKRTHLWLTPYSQIDRDSMTGNFCGIHVVRNPYQLIVSAYLFHKTCDEPWCIKTNYPTKADGIVYSVENRSYQDCLNSLDQEEGLLFEMNGRSFKTIMDMYNWNYEDEKFLNIRFEDIMRDFDSSMRAIFRHLNLDQLGIDQLLHVASRHNVQRWSKLEVEANPHIVNKEQRTYTYRDVLTKKHLTLFREKFPNDLLAKIGYGHESGESASEAAAPRPSGAGGVTP